MLQDLLTKRNAIEKEILQSTARLEKAYSNASQELNTILAARINDISQTSLGSLKA